MADKKYPSANKLDPTRMMLRRAGKIICVLATLIPIFILTLRVVNYPLLLKITPGDNAVTQNPLSSVCFILLGISLWIVRNDSQGNKLQKFVSYIPLLVSLVGFTKLLFVLLGIYYGIDIMLFKSQLFMPVENGFDVVWNEMAPNTAFCFILLGLSVYFIDTDSHNMKRAMQLLNYVIVLIALLSIYGYIYKVEDLYSIFKEIPMSLYTAICFFLFSSSVLFLRPDRGSMSVLIGENPSEVITLRFIAIILPLFFGWIKIKGEDAGLYEKELGTAMFAILNFIIIMSFLGRKSTVQYRLRKAKAKIQEIIKKDRERLKRILDTSPTYLSIFDLESDKIVYYNEVDSSDTVPEITNMHVSEIIDKFIYEDDRLKVKETLGKYKSYKDNEYYSMTYRTYGPDGEIRWLYSRSIVYKRVNGKVTQVLSNATDITEQKQAEEELLESKKFIEKIMNTSANIVYIFDLDEYQSIYANRNIETLLGYTVEEVKELGSELIYSLMHPDDLDRIAKYYNDFKNAKDNEVREIEYRMKTKAGDWIWLYSRDAVFLRNENGDATQIVGIAHDITNRKENELRIKQKNKELSEAYDDLDKAQHKLKEMNSELEEIVTERTKELNESQEKYRAYINQSHEGIWRYEFRSVSYIDTNLSLEEQVELILKHTFIAECNDRMAVIHGFDEGRELVGMPLNEYSLLTEGEQTELAVNFIKSNYRLTDVETLAVNKQGDPKYYRSSIIGIVEDGKLLRAWGTQQDITDQKMAEESLKVSEERYHYMVDRIPEIFWCSKPDGSVQYYNHRWFEYIGDKGNHQLKNWSSFVHPNDVERVVELWEDCIKKDKECYTEYRLKRSDGIFRWHLMRAIPIKDKEDNIINWMSTSADIHEQKVSSYELMDKNRSLAKINAQLHNITHDVSNDLKNTISSIEDLISIHDGKVVESDRKKEEKAWHQTRKSIHKLKKIITNISESENLGE